MGKKQTNRIKIEAYKAKVKPGLQNRVRVHRAVQEGEGPYAKSGALERRFDVPLVAELAQKEKQIQQNYRPVIGVHKWFARRPGTLFRGLLLAEFAGEGKLRDHYFRAHNLAGKTILDPFMGGGTPLFEAIASA